MKYLFRFIWYSILFLIILTIAILECIWNFSIDNFYRHFNPFIVNFSIYDADSLICYPYQYTTFLDAVFDRKTY